MTIDFGWFQLFDTIATNQKMLKLIQTMKMLGLYAQ